MGVLLWLYHGLAWTWGGYKIRSAAAGYNILSGDVGDLFLISAGWIFLRKHNCHVRRCWRLSWHPHPAHGHPVCRRHHPDGGRLHEDGLVVPVAARPSRCDECGARRGTAHHPTCSRSKKNRRKSGRPPDDPSNHST